MASGVNAALEIPIQVQVQALSLAVVTFNTSVNRNNETLQRVRQQPASVRLFFTTLPQAGGILAQQGLERGVDVLASTPVEGEAEGERPRQGEFLTAWPVSLLVSGLSRDMGVQSVSGGMGLVELLEFLSSVESDAMGELNVAYDAARAFVQRVHRWLRDLPAAGVKDMSRRLKVSAMLACVGTHAMCKSSC